MSERTGGAVFPVAFPGAGGPMNERNERIDGAVRRVALVRRVVFPAREDP